MKVTVLVCTRNRSEIIESCILSILHNTYRDFEFLIVDQSTDKKTAQIVEKLMSTDKRITYLHMKAKGKTKALNLGIKESRGVIIAQTDDDCIVAQDWLEKIVGAFQRNPDAVVVFGSVLDSQALFGAQKARGLIENGKFAGRLSKLSFVGDAANRSVKKIVYQKVKGHDELLGTGNPLTGSEDQDFAYRTLKAGFKIITVREIIVTHRMYRVRDMESYLAVLRGFEIGIGAVYLKQLRCLDFISVRILFIRWVRRMNQAMRFILSSKQTFGNKPRLISLLFLWTAITYWTVLGMIKSLKYSVDQKNCLFISKR
ncbi:glycosyltransferase [Candidatus Omnitrophota bacterium]